jgi:hypothetical protein
MDVGVAETISVGSNTAVVGATGVAGNSGFPQLASRKSIIVAIAV